MKLKYSFAFIFLLGVLSLTTSSCKKNNAVIDRDPLVAPAFAEFSFNQGASFSRDFYIENTTEGSVFKVPVGFTNVSSSDRTIAFTYSSPTAVAGTHYTAPASIVIPAGKALDTLRVTGNFDNILTGESHVLKIKITGGDAPAYPGKDSVMLTLRRSCPVDNPAAQIGGDYTKTFEGTYGPYTSSVINLMQTSATTAKATITNIYDNNIEADFIFDWTDRANFKVTMSPATQSTPYTSGGLPLLLRQAPNTTSTFSSCEETITLRLQLYTSAGVYDTWTSNMAR